MHRNESLSPELVSYLQEKGYTLIQELGQGHTRVAYEVQYKHGELSQRRVLKIPKSDLDTSSVIARVNRSKGDLDAREVRMLNGVVHPNIVHMYDAFTWDDRTITVEGYDRSMSLEDLVSYGSIKDPAAFERIFTQVLSGLEYLHSHEGLLHRDIKPSNILVGSQDQHVKLSDLQNVGKIDSVDSMLPTRGATDYTHPDVLNALIKGKRCRVDLRSELYSLGATMYYTLCKQSLFSRAMTQAPDGASLVLGDEQLRVRLSENGNPVDSIDHAKHSKLLAKRLQEVPRHYRSFLWKLLDVEHIHYPLNSPHELHQQLRDDLVTAATPGILARLPWDKIRRYAGGFVGGAAVTAGIFIAAHHNEIASRDARARKQTFFETRVQDYFVDGSIEKDLSVEALDLLRSQAQGLQEKTVLLEQMYPKILTRGGYVDDSCDANRMSKRLGKALIRGALLGHKMPDEPIEWRMDYKEFAFKGDEWWRLPTSMVPFSYVLQKYTNSGARPAGGASNTEAVDYGLEYLRYCMGTDPSLANGIAHYYHQSAYDVRELRVRAGDLNYFPSAKGAGYRSGVDPIRRAFIDRTLLLYYLSDNVGNLHFERLSKIKEPIKGLAAK